jgi:hypothetical protein
MEKYLRISVLSIAVVVLALLGYQFFQFPASIRDAWGTGLMFIPSMFWIIFQKLGFVGQLIFILGFMLVVLLKIYDVYYRGSKIRPN